MVSNTYWAVYSRVWYVGITINVISVKINKFRKIYIYILHLTLTLYSFKNLFVLEKIYWFSSWVWQEQNIIFLRMSLNTPRPSAKEKSLMSQFSFILYLKKILESETPVCYINKCNFTILKIPLWMKQQSWLTF